MNTKTAIITVSVIATATLAIAGPCDRLPPGPGKEICEKQRSRMTIEQERTEKQLKQDRQAAYRASLAGGGGGRGYARNSGKLTRKEHIERERQARRKLRKAYKESKQKAKQKKQADEKKKAAQTK